MGALLVVMDEVEKFARAVVEAAEFNCTDPSSEFVSDPGPSLDWVRIRVARCPIIVCYGRLMRLNGRAPAPTSAAPPLLHTSDAQSGKAGMDAVGPGLRVHGCTLSPCS
jgi:hypothetical protein